MTHPLTDDLLKWYDANKRTLPWREIRTPYRTLVSEVMLQQTRVDTVMPYFEAFMEKFPTMETLAEAELDSVLAMWSGLGYYSRARNLHKAAKQVVSLGSFPNTLAEIRKLSGVGEYIAGAIASMAFDLDVGAVDGNLHRVLSRLFCDGGDRQRMWTIIEPLLPNGRCGDFNQALMDLGSGICKKAPVCTSCPIQKHCRAFKERKTDQFPVKIKKKAPKEEFYVALLIRQTNHEYTLWMGQRAPEKLYGGMVEPCLLLDTPDAPTDVLTWITQYTNLPTEDIQWLDKGCFVHILTHKKMNVRVFECTMDHVDKDCFLESTMEPYVEMRWLTPLERETVGQSTLAQKIIDQSKNGQLSLF